MKSLLSLSQLNRDDISQIMDVALEMRRIVNSTYKKGPQLVGAVVANITDGKTVESLACNLAVNYLSGTCYKVEPTGDVDELMRSMDAMGVNVEIICNNDDNLIHNFAKESRCCVINGGSTNSDPLGALADMLALIVARDGINNISVTAVGNKHTNRVADLLHVLKLYNSNFTWYLPADDFATMRRGVVIDQIEPAFKGADVIIDLGITNIVNANKYYGTNGGIAEKYIDLARVGAPLLGARNVVDNVGIKKYDNSIADVRNNCYVAVVMAVLYLMHKN